MPSIPLWVLGKNLTALTIRQQTVGADGALTDGGSGATSLLAIKDGLTFNSSAELENIGADNATIANNVILQDDLSMTINALMPNIGADPHPLVTLFKANSHFKVVMTFGTGGSAKTHTLYFVRGNTSISSVGRGAFKVEATLASVDAGVDTWAIA